MNDLFTAREATSLRCIVDVLDKHDRIPKTFEPHIRTARAKLATATPDFTAEDAAGLCAAAWEYLQVANVEDWPSELRDVVESAWRKLLEVQRDEPVFVCDDEGWKVCFNGSIEYGPFETEDRARFFWSIKPCPLN